MSWGMVAAAAATAVSAGAGVYGSQQAAKQSAQGSKNAIAEQQRQYNIGLNMLEPTRSLGYGALSDLSSLYGYALPAYTPVNELLAGAGGAGGGTITVGGRAGRTDWLNPGGAFGLGGNKSPIIGGTINPYTGTVVTNGKKAAERSAAATAYLRGESDDLSGKKWRRIRQEIDALRAGGYEYDPSAADQQQAGPIAGGAGTSADGTSGNFGRFFASPDYRFRLGEGVKTLDQSAAARGGLFSGNTGRSLTQYGQGLAAGEYGNYVNRLLAMAGLGQTATTQGVQLGQNTANNVSGFMQNAADARASGVMGAANSITGSINSGLNAYLLRQYMNRPTGT